MLFSPNFEEAVKEAEKLGFAIAHEKDGIADHNNSQRVLRDGAGNKVDVVSLSNQSQIQRPFVGIRMNVENFDEALKEFEAMGYRNLKPENVESKSSKSTMIMPPQGFMYLLCEHIK